MATKTTGGERYGFGRSILRSVVTQYWVFTLYVIGYGVFGLGLAAVDHPWRWPVAATAILSVFFGLEGFHALDLSGDDIATRVDGGVQTVVGVVGLVIGAGLGVYLASITSLWFLVVVAVELFLGAAYNLEWFNGLLHDFTTPSGMANFGVSWGAIPFVGGYFVMSGTLNVGVLVVGIGVALDAMRLISLFEISKPEPYNDLGIHHTRDIDPDPTFITKMVHQANKMSTVAWVCIAVGTVLMFAW